MKLKLPGYPVLFLSLATLKGYELSIYSMRNTDDPESLERCLLSSCELKKKNNPFLLIRLENIKKIMSLVDNTRKNALNT